MNTIVNMVGDWVEIYGAAPVIGAVLLGLIAFAWIITR